MCRKNNLRILIFIIIAGALLRFALVYFSCDISYGTDAVTYDNIAQNIAFKGVYSAKPPQEAPRPTAIYTPVYPLFVAGIYRLLGYNVKIVSYIHIILYAIASLVIFKLGDFLFDKKAGLWAVIFFSVEPVSVFYSVVPMPEILIAIFLPLSVYFLFKFIKQDAPLSWKNPAYSALLLGVAILTKPVLIFFPIIFLAALIIFLARKPLKLFYAVFIIAAIITTVLSPWIIRNYRLYNKFCFAKSIDFISACKDYGRTHRNLILDKEGNLPLFIAQQAIRYSFGTNSILIYKAVFKGNSLFYQYARLKMAAADKKSAPTPDSDISLSKFKVSTIGDYLKLFRYSPGFLLLQAALTLTLLAIYTFLIRGIYFAFKHGRKKEAFVFCVIILYFAAVIIVAVCGSRYRFPSAPFYCILAGYGARYFLKVPSRSVSSVPPVKDEGGTKPMSSPGGGVIPFSPPSDLSLYLYSPVGIFCRVLVGMLSAL